MAKFETLLTQQEVADILRVTTRRLRALCSAGDGPAETRIGASVRYAESDVRSWLESHRRRRDVA